MHHSTIQLPNQTFTKHHTTILYQYQAHVLYHDYTFTSLYQNITLPNQTLTKLHSTIPKHHSTEPNLHVTIHFTKIHPTLLYQDNTILYHTITALHNTSQNLYITIQYYTLTIPHDTKLNPNIAFIGNTHLASLYYEYIQHYLIRHPVNTHHT